MLLSMSKVSGCTTLRNRANIIKSCTPINSFVKPIQYSASYATYQRIDSRRHSYGHGFGAKLTLSSEGLLHKCTKPHTSTIREHYVQSQSTGTHNTEAKECARHSDDCSDASRKALANALASAPSMWTLGNAGMGALQRLAKRQ